MTEKRICHSCNGRGSKDEIGTEFMIDYSGNMTVIPTFKTVSCSYCYGSGKVQ